MTHANHPPDTFITTIDIRASVRSGKSAEEVVNGLVVARETRIRLTYEHPDTGETYWVTVHRVELRDDEGRAVPETRPERVSRCYVVLHKAEGDAH